MPVRAALLALALALVLMGCAGEDEAAPPATQPPAATTGETQEETAPATTEPAEPVRLRLEEVATADAPVHVAVAPGEPDRLYVVERGGRILVLEGGTLRDEPFLDIADSVSTDGEQGLLSVAFHPDYEQNRLLYVNHTDEAGDTRVAEYASDGERVDEGSRRELLHVEQPYSNHNGGQLAFGPDGLLYVGMGDGGSGGDPENRAQDMDELLGKLLRIDVDREDARPQIAALGLRNPWRFSFDREAGDLWLADVGQNAKEEVNVVPSGRSGLLNFGWDVYEGDELFEDKELGPGRLVEPVAVYGRDGGCSVTGGYVYRGEAIPSLRGRYFYGDYCSGYVWSLAGRDGQPRREGSLDVPTLVSFGEDPDGELLLVALNGSIFRIVADS